MAWVWDFPREHEKWGADVDHIASAPLLMTEDGSDKPIDTKLRPVYRSRSGIKRFKQLHSPPMSTSIAVDELWKSIILKYVPADRIQFLPIRLIARGEICDDFMWLIPFDRVICIDKEKSEITRKREKPDLNLTLIYGVKKFVHFPNCLGKLHLARDAQMLSHVLVSDELKEALSATGQDSVFYRPEDVITIDNFFDRKRGNFDNTKL
jgi:hypothetical protein